ncbi:hypothetical protein FNV43_RR26736 [Rhamnella rubrinervis]|uniref:F-box domain-containing protein n=1 Tax=Rhamnella rubrinervis TaxID=2594499 RepID=A0A8K0DPP2_9ROSA|nr:hypothetical protein FNV43_RR26736 [Rhamnella rubrinervis]
MRSTRKNWSHLPHDLLLQIAKRLGLIDLLRFRVVCKDFLHASSTATGENEVESLPWFLAYGRRSCECTVISYTRGSTSTKIHTLNLPQLQGGAICLGSNQGWLLVFQRGSMFFFCPFSKAKIDLPDFPCTKLKTYHTAAFSCPPWSQDCIVIVITRIDNGHIGLYLLNGGYNNNNNNNWISYKFNLEKSQLHNIEGGAYYYGETFYFFDSRGKGISYSPTEQLLKPYLNKIRRVIISSKDDQRVVEIHPPLEYSKETIGEQANQEFTFGFSSFHLLSMNVWELLGFQAAEAEFSTCGTLTQLEHLQVGIQNEKS